MVLRNGAAPRGRDRALRLRLRLKDLWMGLNGSRGSVMLARSNDHSRLVGMGRGDKPIAHDILGMTLRRRDGERHGWVGLGL